MSIEMKKLVIGNDEFEVVDAAARSGIGSPLMASTVAGMTDTTKIYVYTGSETGYTSGNWYYYNGSAWTSGGVYNSAAIEIDDTLSTAGVAADAKAAGDAIDEIADALETKAEVDGAYESMTVGNAEQLISTVGIDESVPYNFRTSGGSIDIGNRETDKIVGGTVAWNQKVLNGNFSSTDDLHGIAGTLLVSDNVGKLVPNGNFSSTLHYGIQLGADTLISGHTYLMQAWCKSTQADKFRIRFSDITTYTNNLTANTWGYVSAIGKANNNPNLVTIYAYDDTLYTTNDEISFKDVVIFDLTQMFGSTIADYIYTLEQNTEGAGVAWFKKLFPADYYEYNAGELMSVNAASHDMVGFNAYNHTAGTAKLVGGNQYQITGTYTAITLDGETVTPDEDGYFTPSANGVLTVTGGNATDTCVHLVWDGEKDGEYEPYVKNSYPLDSDLELRGIPKLDAYNQLYYDGDTYEADGTVTRKYGIVDLGTLTWSSWNPDESLIFNATLPGKMNQRIKTDCVCCKYTYRGQIALWSDLKDKEMTGNVQNSSIYIRDTAYSNNADFKAAMSGVYIVYELETPTTESADPYTELQMVDDFGTEEYVDAAYAAGTRDVAIPVGHETVYMANLRAKLEMLPDSPDGDGDYIVRQSNGTNSFVLYSEVHELPDAPSEDGTYVLKCTVSDGNATYAWVAEE